MQERTQKNLADMLEKAIDTDSLTKNTAKQIVIDLDKKERRVLALETDMRIGELCGLQWEDIDFKNKMLYANHTLCYFSNGGKYVLEIHDTKINNDKRTIPLTERAIKALRRQKIQKQEIRIKEKTAPEGYENLVLSLKIINQHNNF